MMLCVLWSTGCGACSDGPVFDPLCDDDPGALPCYATWDQTPAAPSPDCHVSACLTGAIDQYSGSNARFQSVCEHEAIPGLLEDCDGAVCTRTFDSFTLGPADGLYRQLFEALDTNADGFVDGGDEACQVNLIGFSWGAMTAVEITRRLELDARITEQRARVDRLLLLDPYRPGGTLRIPKNAVRTRIWRQSASPEGDCSRVAPGGPYRGIVPECPAEADCVDVDISKLEGSLPTTDPLLTLDASQVGHCDVPWVSRDGVMRALYVSPSAP